MISVINFATDSLLVVNDFVLAGHQKSLELNVTHLFTFNDPKYFEIYDVKHRARNSLSRLRRAVFVAINQFHVSGPCSTLYVYISTQNSLLSSLTCAQLMVPVHWLWIQWLLRHFIQFFRPLLKTTSNCNYDNLRVKWTDTLTVQTVFRV